MNFEKLLKTQSISIFSILFIRTDVSILGVNTFFQLFEAGCLYVSLHLVTVPTVRILIENVTQLLDSLLFHGDGLFLKVPLL